MNLLKVVLVLLALRPPRPKPLTVAEILAMRGKARRPDPR